MMMRAMVLMAVLMLTGSVWAQQIRYRWEFNLGSFIDQGKGEWIEVNNQKQIVGTYTRTEINQDYIEITSSDGRGFIPRLYGNSATSKGKGDQVFKKIYDGKWVK